MNRGLKIGLVVAGLLTGAAALAYYRNVQQLDIGLKSVVPTGLDANGNILFDVTLSVGNSTPTGFPVPTVTADLYSGSQHLATGESDVWQYIAPNTTSYLTLTAAVSVAEAGPYIYNIFASGQAPPDLNIKGTAHIVGYDLDFATQIIQLSS